VLGSVDEGGPRELSGGRLIERLRTAVPPVGLLAVAFRAGWYLWFHDPHLSGQCLPWCPWRRLTGLQCPACGGTRMAYDLVHGQVGAAWHDNAALLLALPLVVWLYGTWLREGLFGRSWHFRPSRRRTAAILSVALVWTVMRNL
jgi:hypothetical protein